MSETQRERVRERERGEKSERERGRRAREREERERHHGKVCASCMGTCAVLRQADRRTAVATKRQ